MAANALTFQEIHAFNSLAHAGLTAWQVELIERLDDAALGVSRAARTATDKAEASTEIPASNARGVRSLLRDLMTRKNQERAKNG
jgi:hypothetical protein